MGTDGAGSVRIPAAFCGNVGMKASFGRVPAYPLSPFGSVAHVGPHTMSVTDCALMMNVVAQPDPRDWTSLPYDGVDYLADLNAGIRGMRIAYSPTLGYAEVDTEVAALVAAAVGELESLGAIVEQVDPGFEDPLDISTGLWFVASKTVYDSLGPQGQEVTDPDFAAQAAQGAEFSAQDVQLLTLKRNALGTLMREFMTRYDVLVTPAVAKELPRILDDMKQVFDRGEEYGRFIHGSFGSGQRGTTAACRAEQGTSTGGGRVSERIFKKQPALQLATPEEESIQARRGERWWVIIREEVAEATPMTIESTRALMLPSCLSGFRFGF
jgi:Asp-tRNA(Asn)/Glu-tRNA(Gln) amidotransferase A subunit family amidase